MIKLNKPFVSKIAGLYFCHGHEALQSVSVGEQLLWEREPNNRFDKNAIKIMNSKREMIGYIPKDLVKEIVPMMESKEVKDMKVTVNEFNKTERNQSCNINIELL